MAAIPDDGCGTLPPRDHEEAEETPSRRSIPESRRTGPWSRWTILLSLVLHIARIVVILLLMMFTTRRGGQWTS